jgi:hypothetical protein
MPQAACAWAVGVIVGFPVIRFECPGHSPDHGSPVTRSVAASSERRGRFHGVDRRLMSSVKDGQVAGLAGLFDRHGASCLSIAHDLLESDQAAQDIVFDVFLGVWRDPAADRFGPLREHLTRQTVAACVASKAARPKRNLDGPTRV